MTPRTHALTQAIAALSRDGVAPSYQELAAALGLASRACVHRLVRQAEREGRVERLPGRARSLRLAGPPELAGLSDASLAALLQDIRAERRRRRANLIGTKQER